MIALFGLSSLPKELIQQYDRIYLLQCFVRGFKYYKGPELLESMHEGAMLELVREPGNSYDSNAIALHFNGHKIGFLPAEENKYLSKILDAGLLELLAEITHLNPDAATWENVHVAVYALKESGSSDLPEYLTTLESPQYFTLNHRGDKISRINTNKAVIEFTPEDFKSRLDQNQTLEKNQFITDNFDSENEFEIAVTQHRFIIDEEQLPADLKSDIIKYPVEEGIISIDHVMDKKGYIVANMNRLSELGERISGFERKLNTKGDFLYEAKFTK